MEQTEGKVCVCACVRVCVRVCACVCMCVHVCALQGPRRERRGGGDLGMGRGWGESLAGMGGHASGLRGFEGGLGAGEEGKVGGVEGVGRWGRGGGMGLSDGAALSWDLGVEVGWGRG